jgi:hypothetical protein
MWVARRSRESHTSDLKSNARRWIMGDERHAARSGGSRFVEETDEYCKTGRKESLLYIIRIELNRFRDFASV